MAKKVKASSKNSHADIERHIVDKTLTELMADIPDFTTEQWEWLKKCALEFEKSYVPTRTIIEGC